MRNAVGERPIVCWDFDETLGYFRPLEYAYLGQEPPATLPEPALKPGIAELLATLPQFAHVVATAAIAAYADEVLERYGLRKFFADVIGREHGMFPSDGKDYGVVGERLGISESALPERLAIVGNDARRDPDLRGRQIVFVHDEAMCEQPAEPLGIVLRALSDAGAGDWKRGFDRLHERAGGARAMIPQLELEGRVRFRIDYWGDYANGRLHPVISRPREIGTK